MVAKCVTFPHRQAPPHHHHIPQAEVLNSGHKEQKDGWTKAFERPLINTPAFKRPRINILAFKVP